VGFAASPASGAAFPAVERRYGQRGLTEAGTTGHERHEGKPPRAAVRGAMPKRSAGMASVDAARRVACFRRQA
jgi:hypothetical protein